MEKTLSTTIVSASIKIKHSTNIGSKTDSKSRKYAATVPWQLTRKHVNDLADACINLKPGRKL
jgi:hypothetical protein